MNRKSGTNIVDVQKMNRALVVDLLRRHRLCSRIQLSHATGLKRATITNIVADLMEFGLVRETGRLVGEKGRRAVGIELNADRFKVIGIRIVQRWFDIALIDILGNLCHHHRTAILPEDTPRSIVDKIKKDVWGFIDQADTYEIIGIGMGAPGPILFHKGRIAFNHSTFPGWENISVTDEFAGEFGIPFFYDHDANAGVLSEWRYGKYARQTGTMVFLVAGDGIGSGIVIDGEVQHGSQGFFGEVGHTSINFEGPQCGCGNRGCLELYASVKAMLRFIRQKLPEYPQSTLHQTTKLYASHVIDALSQEDALAVAAIERTATFLGYGIVNIINAYDPDVIIIGDDLSAAGQVLLDTIHNVVQQHVMPEIYSNIQIVLSSFKVDPVLLGTGSIALDNLVQGDSLLHPPRHTPELEEDHE